MCCPAPLFFFDVLGSNWGQNQFFCKKTKKYSAENDVFSALFLVAGVNKQYYVQPYISAKKQHEKKNQVRCGDKAKISSDAVKKSVASLLFWVYKDF